MQLNQDLIVSKWFSLSPDKDSDESKSFKLELTIPKGTTTNDMALAILKGEVIRVQNAKRNQYDKLVDKSTFKTTFKRPVGEVDPVEAIRNEAIASGIDINDTDAMTLFIMKKLANK